MGLRRGRRVIRRRLGVGVLQLLGRERVGPGDGDISSDERRKVLFEEGLKGIGSNVKLSSKLTL